MFHCQGRHPFWGMSGWETYYLEDVGDSSTSWLSSWNIGIFQLSGIHLQVCLFFDWTVLGWLQFRSLSLVPRLFLLSGTFSICSHLVAYSPYNWLTTNWESHRTPKGATLTPLIILRHVINASCSVSLIITLKVWSTEYLKDSPLLEGQYQSNARVIYGWKSINI